MAAAASRRRLVQTRFQARRYFISNYQNRIIQILSIRKNKYDIDVFLIMYIFPDVILYCFFYLIMKVLYFVFVSTKVISKILLELNRTRIYQRIKMLKSHLKIRFF